MDVAPINEVRKVINYAVSVIPRKKIMMGILLYGYNRTLPYLPKGEFAKSVGCSEAAVRSVKAQSTYYNYMSLLLGL